MKYGAATNIRYRKMTSDEQIQGTLQTLRQATRSSSKLPQDTQFLLNLKGRFSPGSILLITLVGIALAEVVAMVVVYYFKGWSYPMQVLLDATVMTVIIFPLLYFLSFRPLLVHIRQRNQADSILQARLHLMQFTSTHTLDELLQLTLDETERLTGSAIGFFHFLEADQTTLRLQAWSTNTLQNMCKAEGKGLHYAVEQAGVWADAVRSRQPVIHNSYATLPHRKGMPDGHARVTREMVIPILRERKVVAILGVGNKSRDYTANDVEIASTLADFAWDIIVHNQAESALRKSEEKFRTLVDWTYDWEKWLDPHGNLVYISPSCERITGYTPEEFMADPQLLSHIIHPDDRQTYEKHQKTVHKDSIGPVSFEYRIISRDGREHWIEHICRPLFGPDERYLGRRISDREITERKQAERKIFHQNQKEIILTQTLDTIQTDIARDLHDTLGQNISFLRMNLAHLSERKSGNEEDLRIQNMTKAADESYELIRSLLSMLQSGITADPLSLFTRYANQVSERSALQINLTSQGNPNHISPHQTRQLFYIFREALSNIEKHASASKVSGEFLWGENALTFGISDNGNGFDPNTVRTDGHYGLNFMRERAEQLKGSFLIHSAPGQGTKITIVVPYEHNTLS